MRRTTRTLPFTSIDVPFDLYNRRESSPFLMRSINRMAKTNARTALESLVRASLFPLRLEDYYFEFLAIAVLTPQCIRRARRNCHLQVTKTIRIPALSVREASWGLQLRFALSESTP